MFTGIVETMGTVRHCTTGNKSVTIGIFPDLSPFLAKIGDSISINGVCQTVESMAGSELFFTAVNETLLRSTLDTVRVGQRVNLERALRLSDRMGGHIVLGHVDDVGIIKNIREVGNSLLMSIQIPPKLVKYMASKGSVALDGISLTIASVVEEAIEVSIIPHTLKETTLNQKKNGDRVNIECDLFARYIERLLSCKKENDNEPVSTTITDDRLKIFLEEGRF